MERELHKEIFKLWLEVKSDEGTEIIFEEDGEKETYKAHLINMVLKIDEFFINSKLEDCKYIFTLIGGNTRIIEIREVN